MLYGADLANVYDLVYAGDRPKDYAAEAEAIAQLIKVRQPHANSVLDVGCGTGQHLSHLRLHFADVAGLDLSEAMLNVAAERVPRDQLHIGDMRTFQLARQFSAITCLFSSIGYVQSLEELRQTMGRFDSHLLAGGVLIVEPWFFPDQFEAGRIHTNFGSQHGTSLMRMSYWERNGERSCVTMHYLLGTRKKGVRSWSEVHLMSLFHREQYEQIITAAGFNDIEWLPSWREDRMRIVATKSVRPGSFQVARPA